MQRHNKDSWKEKLDPAFDTFLKGYVAFLSKLESYPNEGQLAIPADLAESIIKNHAPGTDNEAQDDSFKYTLKAGGLSNKDINLYSHVTELLKEENYKKLFEICHKLIKYLPEEESREYYINKIGSYKIDPDFELSDGLPYKTFLDSYSTVFSLLARYFFLILFKNDKEIKNNKIEYFKKSGAKIAFLNTILSSFSQLAHQTTLAELEEKISKGDDKSIFKAVTIDKAVLFNKNVKNRITTAQLTGDTEFLKKLGKAIAKNPFEKIAQHGKTYSILKTFWIFGLYKLTNEELYDFLTSCGLIPPAYPDAFQKFVKRNIRSVYRF